MTRSNLLTAAGEVFAEVGFDGATAKEIAAQAKTNAAAVNYHFGGIVHLYEEVLAEAHRRMLGLEHLLAALAAEADPQAKLRRFIGLVVTTVRSSPETTWPAKVLVREILSPTPHFDKLRKEELEPKKALVTATISELTGLPKDHPLVAQALLSIMGPCLMLLIADRRVSEIFPVLGKSEMSDEDLANRLADFALAGIAQLARSPAAR